MWGFTAMLRSMWSPLPPTTVIITLNGLSRQKTVNRGFWVDLWQAQLGSGLQADWLLWRQRPCSTLMAGGVVQISTVLITDYCPEMRCASLVPLCDGPCLPNVFGWSPSLNSSLFKILPFHSCLFPGPLRNAEQEWRIEKQRWLMRSTPRALFFWLENNTAVKILITQRGLAYQERCISEDMKHPVTVYPQETHVFSVRPCTCC